MNTKALLDFVTQVQADKLGVEAIAVADEQQLLFEHHFVPGFARNIYSHTKSFTSTAVGFAISEGLLSLDDRPAACFPESLPADVDPAWDSVTLRDCLMMSSGVGQPLLMMNQRWAGEGFPDYLKYLFAHPLLRAPGTQHCYNNGDTYLCGRMVEKATGKTLIAYLFEKCSRPWKWDIPPGKWTPWDTPLGLLDCI